MEPKQNNRSRKVEAIDVDTDYELKHTSRRRRVEAIDVVNTEDIQSDKDIKQSNNVVDTDYELKQNSRRRRVEAIDVVNTEDIQSDKDFKQSNNVVRKIPSPVKIMPGLSRQELEHLAVILAEIQESKRIAAESIATAAVTNTAFKKANAPVAAVINTPDVKESRVQSSPPISKSDYATLIEKIKSLEELTVVLKEQSTQGQSKTAVPLHQPEQSFNPTTLNAMFSNGIPTAAFPLAAPISCPNNYGANNAYGAQNSSYYGANNGANYAYGAHNYGIHQNHMQGGYNFFSSPPPTVQTSNNNHISDDNLLGYLNMTNNSLLAYMRRRT